MVKDKQKNAIKMQGVDSRHESNGRVCVFANFLQHLRT